MTCSSMIMNLRKSKSLKGTEVKKKKKEFALQESYRSNKVICMPRVLKGKQAVFYASLSIFLYPRTPQRCFCSRCSPLYKGSGHWVWVVPQTIFHHCSAPDVPKECPSSTLYHLSHVPDWLEQAVLQKGKGQQEEKIFPDLRGQKLHFLECRPGVCHFYFTEPHTNLSNLCIYPGYFYSAPKLSTPALCLFLVWFLYLQAFFNCWRNSHADSEKVFNHVFLFVCLFYAYILKEWIWNPPVLSQVNKAYNWVRCPCSM